MSQDVNTDNGSALMKLITHKLAKLLEQRAEKRHAPTLGARELEVMKVFWQADALTAKQVLDRLTDTTPSLSTMQSTLERLHRKNLLVREKKARFYLYRAAVTRSEIITQLMEDISEHISDGEMAPMISGFMAFVGRDVKEIEVADNWHAAKKDESILDE